MPRTARHCGSVAPPAGPTRSVSSFVAALVASFAPSLATIVLAPVLLIGGPSPGIAAKPPPPAPKAEKPAGYIGSAACSGCHSAVAKAFATSPHARSAGWTEKHGCESCHGPGLEHVSKGGAKGSIPQLGKLPPAEAAKTCGTCHQGKDFADSSHHAFNEVGCTSCHAVHGTREKLLRQPEVELCSSCHGAVAAKFKLPRSHPLSQTGGGCVSCHPPHGSAGPGLGKASDSCTSCHSTMRGPFIYPHDVGLLEGCGACHEAHGSTNRHLLKYQRQVELCYSCHVGADTPTFHSFGRFVGEKCTACHTAVHGSNTSPAFLEE